MSLTPGTSEVPVTESAPVLRIVRGTPDATEVAAVTAVILARGADGGEATPVTPAVGGWSNRSHGMRTPLPQGRGAWRHSARAR